MGKRGNIIIIILGILLLLTGIGFYIINNKKLVDEKKDFQSSLKSQFSFKTIDGKKINIEASGKQFRVEGMEDKIVLLKVFGWDCKFCQKEIPQLIQLKKDLSNSIEIIAIEAQQHSIEASQRFAKEYGINYPIVAGEGQEKFYRYLETKYGWSGVIPLTIVLGKGGKVLAFERGEKSYTLAELLKASLLRE